MGREGLEGPPGIDGLQGKDGSQGLKVGNLRYTMTGTQKKKTEWFMNNYILFSKGEQGDDGEVGLPGKPGNRGKTGEAGHPGIQGFSGPKVIALKSAIQLSSDSFATVY